MYLMTRAQRFLSRWVIPVVALTIPLGANALGLGEARVESFLNQPLDVRMRLLDVTEDDLDSLTVAPATGEDYQRLGLMSDSLALGLQISVDRSVSPPIVRVTSARAVSDPVVQLLVDARWSSGRMLREYTLFLDPPTVEVEPPAPATSPAAASEPADSVRPDQTPDRRQTARPASDSAADQPSPGARPPVATTGARSYGPVASGETLWSIASANLPAGDVTMDQMMIAIVELNPGAFRDQNINQLLRGARLQLPDAERVRALDAATASAEVAAQNRAFSRRMDADVPVVSSAGREQEIDDAQASAVEVPPGRTGADDTADHRLSLVPPGDENAGSGLSDDAAEVADLRQRLARAEEELYAARQEADEFQSRVEELETLVRRNPQGIGLRDVELAGLEATLRAAREATQADADPQMRAEVSERLDDYLEQYAEASRTTDAGDGMDEDNGGQSISAVADSANDATGADPEPIVDAEGTAAGNVEPENVPQNGVSERAVTEVETSRGFLFNPVVWLVAGLVLVLVVLAVGRRAMQRDRQPAEPTAPFKRAADLPRPASTVEDPATNARVRLDADPGDLSAHLALLQTLATEGREEEFGDALESMFEHVESEAEPEWREAIELAGRVVPGHPLAKGNSDWVAETEQTSQDEPATEVDQESEVDDLMSRLDSDLEETDDREWLGEEDPDKSAGQKAPLLREDYDTELGDDADTDAGSGGDSDEFDLTAWGDEDSEPTFSDEAEDEARDSDAPDDLVLDWPDEVEQGGGTGTSPSSGEELSGNEAESHDAAGGAQTDDDIFAQSDDDIDVKLDLAKAYLSWNSIDSARTLLQEVVREGNPAQQEQAQTLLDGLADDSEN